MVTRLSKVWVLGLGTAGSHLTALLARGGLRVLGVEADERALDTGKARVRECLERSGSGDEELPAFLKRVDYTTEPRLGWPPDLVIEALPERLELKVGVLRAAGAMCGTDTIFATTTAGLSVTEIASRTGRMVRTVGIQFPAYGSRTTMELTRTPVTDPAVTRDVGELLAAIGMVPVVSHDHPGSVGNALFLGYLNRAAALYERGYATREGIDTAMRLGCGLPRGPLAQLDEIGLDTVVDSLTALGERSGFAEHRPSPILARMVAGGLLGRKSGQGFYQYDNGAPVAGHPAGEDRPEPRPRPVRSIGIVGTGSMAIGIAEVSARAGYHTIVTGRTAERATRAVAAAAASMNRAVQRKRLSAEAMDSALGRLDGAGDLAALAECDLTFEAVVEDLDVKRSVFGTLDRLVRPGAVLATNTSSLPVLGCAGATQRPGDVVGMHFFNPAPMMRLVELVDTPLSAADAVATGQQVVRTMGKTVVRCCDRTGFIVNALLFPYLNRAVTMLRDRHLRVDDVDAVMTGHGFPLGPFRLLDLIGLDVSVAILRRLADDTGDPDLVPARDLVELAASGCLGRKTGRGFHQYTA
jgi:3-hydroxybutyryl-CoA dehydrogenase